jgi:translation elongation factor EF-G
MLFVIIFVSMGIIFFRMIRKKTNPIDFTIIELNRTGCVVRREIGRRIFSKVGGYTFVTAKILPSSIKDRLGPNIGSNNIYPNKYGNGRVTCIGLWKDGVFAPGELGTKVEKVFVPLGEMFGYTTNLRSMTKGRASSSMELDHYADVPNHVTEAIVAKAGK